MRNPELSWRLAYWRRVMPGSRGFAVLAAVPALLFLPLETIGLFESWRQGTIVILWLLSFALAAVLGRDSARPGPGFFWIYQKGGSPADFAMRRWLFDGALGLAVILLWTGAWVLASELSAREPLSAAAAVLTMSGATFLVAHAALFPAAAAGWSRGVDALVLLALVSLLEPVLFDWLPGPLGAVLHWLLPPLLHATEMSRLVAAGQWTGLVGEIPHVLLFVAACCAASASLLRRWRP